MGVELQADAPGTIHVLDMDTEDIGVVTSWVSADGSERSSMLSSIVVLTSPSVEEFGVRVLGTNDHLIGLRVDFPRLCRVRVLRPPDILRIT